ncbi:synaptosomal-associated protein 23-like isoform X2 [Ctenopharyngodon idella]|uniref:synaptosomal-associated protein 23-like isoform X2 n=1 Tax=Ctenopharyngodon idella TaxID=7959 RepID=UPI0022304B92|nr:synaptosomal-associated protein 23-like isoform X2 [Ctenopharyngodon idella]
MPAESQSSRMADMSTDEITIEANRLTNESMDVGGKTLTMLDEQGEKLKNVKLEMDQIEQDVKQARKNLNELSKCCGLCLWPCNRLKSTKTDRRYKQGKKPKENKRNVVSSQENAIRNGQAVSAVSAASSGPYVKRITNDEREVEMEEDLKQVGDNIGNLKNMALEMNAKLSEQNQTLKDITDKADKTKAHIDEAIQQANKLL